MATATYGVSTSASDLNTLWRKVQVGVVKSAQFATEEWDFLMGQPVKDLDIDWSAREITVELDLEDDVGTSVIPEGGKEARPSSPKPITGTLTYQLLNGRFTISKTAQYIAEHTPKAMLEDQLKYQAMKKVEGMRRKIGDMFYGFSDGIVAIVNGSPSSDVFTLDSMYQQAGVGDAAENHPVTDLFRVGDYVWVLNPTGPAIRGTQPEKITAVTAATPSITLAATPASSADNDLIVFGNNLENTTLADGSEHNEWFTGLLDMATSTTLHSVSGSTYAKWNFSTKDTGGGRFTGIKLRKGKQGIHNEGGGKMDTVLWANGVENDVVAQLQAGLRFSDAYAMEMDGQAKSRGITFKTTRRVPDGYAFAWDSKNSIRKGNLLDPTRSTPSFGDGEKLQDDSGLVFSLDFPVFLVTLNRGNMAYWSGLTQQ